jgi:hypothetical protein
MNKANAAPFTPTHTLRAGWGYHVGMNFHRATTDTPVRVDLKAYAKPGHVVAYTETGERRHVTKRSLTEYQEPGGSVTA